MNNLNSQLNGVNQSLNVTRRNAQTAANDIERFGEQAAIAIRRYGGFTLATTAFMKLTNAITSGVQDAIKFDREMVRLAQVTGNTLSGVKDLGDEVSRLAREYGTASNEILEASVTLAQAGINAKDVKVILESIAKTGVSATFGDIKNTTEAVIAAMQQFNLKASDMEETLSSINSVSAKFAVEASDITTAIVRTGGAFQAAGGDIREFQALFTSVRQTTRESAETIATGFRTIFTRLQRSRTQNFLESLGINLKDVEGQFVGPYEAIRRLSTALRELKGTDPRFAQIIEELGGFRQISKVIPLITKFDVAQQALNVSLRSGNSLTVDAEVAQQSLEVQITKVREEFLALIREVSSNTAFRGFIDMTLKLSSSLIKLADTLSPIIPLLGAVGAIRISSGISSFARGFSRRFADGGPVHKFASGGLVPGQGNGDTVSAMLTPGEFVIRKKAVEAIGVDKLRGMNKYADGGFARGYADGGFTQDDKGNYLYQGRKFTKKQAFPSITKTDAERNKSMTALLQNNVSNPEYQEVVGRLNKLFNIQSTAAQESTVKKERLESKTPSDIMSKKTPKISIVNIPDLVTGDERWTGKSRNVKVSSTIAQLLKVGSGTKEVQDKLFNSIYGSESMSDADKRATAFEAKVNTHGLNKGLGDSFHANAEVGILDVVDKIVNGSGMERFTNNKKLNARELLEETAINSVKGSLLEGVVRQISGVAVSQSATNNVIDFDSIPTGIFEGNIASSAEAKIKANNKAFLSTIVKGLKNNSYAKPYGLLDFDNEPKKFASGGKAQGTDTVPAMLTPGEFVINKRAAERIGAPTLHKMNRADKFAKGGMVGDSVQKFAIGGAVGSAASNIASNPIALGLLLSSINSFAQSLSGGNKELQALTETISSVGFQFSVLKTVVSGVKDSVPSLNNIGYNDTRTRQDFTDLLTPASEERKNRYARKTNANSQLSEARKAARIERFNAAEDARLNANVDSEYGRRDRRIARGFSIGGTLAGGAALYAGTEMSNRANRDIAEGKDSTQLAAWGGAASGAGQGAAIGAIFGPIGIATGALVGGLVGYTRSLSAAKKELDNVKFSNKLVEFSKTLDSVIAGRRSVSDARSNIINTVREASLRLTSSTGEDRQNLKANFGNDANKIEQFIGMIARDAASFGDLEKQTKNLLVDFALLTDLPYASLKDQLTKQIEAQKKAEDFAKKSDMQQDAQVRATLSLIAMSEAIQKVSSSFGSFDSAIDSYASFIEGKAGANSSKDITSLLEKAAKGNLGDTTELVTAARNMTSGFGDAGAESVTKLDESARLLAQLPALLLDAKNNTGFGDNSGRFEDVLASSLKGKFSDSTIESVLGGVRTVIGAEGKDEKIIDGIRNNLDATANEVGKTLQSTISAFKEFAPAFKEQGDRINKVMEIYEGAVMKASDVELQKLGRQENLLNIISSAYDKPRRFGSVREGELARVRSLTGGTTDIGELEKRLVQAQQNSRNLGEQANNATDLNDKLKARRLQADSNIEMQKTIKALQELTNVSSSLSEIQSELADTERGRQVKSDFFTNAVFGSRETKMNQERTIAASATAARFGIDFIPDKDKENVLKFFQSLGKNVKFGGLTGEEQIQNIAKNSMFGQQFEAMNGPGSIDALLKPGMSKEAQVLLEAAGKLTEGANQADTVLQRNSLELATSLNNTLTEQNQAFLEGLRSVFVENQIRGNNNELQGIQNNLFDALEKFNAFANISKRFGVNDSNMASFTEAKRLAESRLSLRRRDEELSKIRVDKFASSGDDNKIKNDALLFASKAGITDKNLEANIDAALNNVRRYDTGVHGEAIKKPQAEIEKLLNNAVRMTIQQSIATERSSTGKELKANENEMSQTDIGKRLFSSLNVDINQAAKSIEQLNTQLKLLGNSTSKSVQSDIDKLIRRQSVLSSENKDLEAQLPIKRASGGHVPGVGNTDVIPAMLTPGEFVMKKSAVESIGLNNLYAMNNGYNAGGLVKFNDGGLAGGRKKTKFEMSEEDRKYRRAAEKAASKAQLDKFLEENKNAVPLTMDQLRDAAFKRHERSGDDKQLRRDLAAIKDMERMEREAKVAEGTWELKVATRKKTVDDIKKAHASRSEINPGRTRAVNAAESVLKPRTSKPRLKINPEYEHEMYMKEAVPRLQKKYGHKLPTYEQKVDKTRKFVMQKRATKEYFNNKKNGIDADFNPALEPREAYNPTREDVLKHRQHVAKTQGAPKTFRSVLGVGLTEKELEHNKKYYAKKQTSEEEAKRNARNARALAKENRVQEIAAAKAARREELKNKKRERRGYNTGGYVAPTGGSGNIDVNGLKDVVQQFSTVVSDMNKQLSQFQDMSITLKATHSVNVTIMGAEVFQNIQPEITKLVVSSTKEAINNMLDSKFPSVGRME